MTNKDAKQSAGCFKHHDTLPDDFLIFLKQAQHEPFHVMCIGQNSFTGLYAGLRIKPLRVRRKGKF
jgi:hypothetical protein